MSQHFVALTVALALLAVMDTGQGLDSNCREISDFCSCPHPHTLRCSTVANTSLEPIWANLTAKEEAFDIRFLHITVDKLTMLKAGTFSLDYPLMGLIISTSQLKGIESGALAKLGQTLTALGLPSNMLGSIPGEVFTLPNLQRLDLSQNFIQSRDIDLQGQTALEYLDLSGNRLEGLDEIRLPPSIRTFIVSENLIDMDGLKGLRGSLGGLQRLKLARNRLADTWRRTSIGQLGGLRSLDLSQNKIARLASAAFANLPQLESLNVSGNRIQVVNETAFVKAAHLAIVDLSHNGIVELPFGLFESLTALRHLDLSDNHLQVFNTGLFRGLDGLEFLDLRRNDIIRLDPLANSPNLTSLLLDSNPLDCTCQLRPLQDWLQKSSLMLESKQTARCTTPMVNANAIVYELPTLTCPEDGQADKGLSGGELARPMSSPGLRCIRKTVLGSRYLQLAWATNLTAFECETVQLYVRDSEDNEVEVYSRPLDCPSNFGIEVSIDLRKAGVADLPSVLACLTLLEPKAFASAEMKADKGASPYVALTDCTRVQLTNTTVWRPGGGLEGRLKALVATSPSLDQIAVDYGVDIGSLRDCRLALQVESADTDDLSERLLAEHKVGCQGRSFTFTGLNLASVAFPRLCARLEAGGQHSNLACVGIDAGNATSRGKLHRDRDKRPLLPLVLTLVFLLIGIAALFVLYLLVRNYLSDRRRVRLFRMRQRSCTEHAPDSVSAFNNNGDNADGPTEIPFALKKRPMLILRLYAWLLKFQPVPASDEMALREETGSTYDTTVL